MNVQTLMYSGKPVEVINKMYPIDQLHLNPENPRIKFQIENNAVPVTTNQEGLLNLVRNQPGYNRLFKSIRNSGGIYDPIIISSDGLVVEGNTRLTVYKSLFERSNEGKVV